MSSIDVIDCGPLLDSTVSEYDTDEAEQLPKSRKDDLDFHLPVKKRKEKVIVTQERKKKILALWDAHKGWDWKTLKTHGAKEITNEQTLHRWRAQVRRGESSFDKYKGITKYVFHELEKARKIHKIIRVSHLKYWGMKKYLELDDNSFKFKASKSWCDKFKLDYRISSRKITKLISKREVKSQDQILESAKKFQTDIRRISSQFDSNHVFNTDQCGFAYEITSARTYTFKGQKSVYGYAQSPNNLSTHSYTVQYLINLAGQIGNVFVCLQEPGGKFGPLVKQDLESYLPSNVTLTCSTSGKLSTSLTEYFLEKQVVPHVTKDFLYIVDSWPGQTNIDTYSKFFGQANDMPEITLKVIPEKCTPLAQPLDTTFHRQLKGLAREILAQLEICVNVEGVHRDDNWNPRKGVIKLNSLLHFFLSAPIFTPMIKYSWFSSGLSDEKVEFLNVKQVCFTFDDDEGKLWLTVLTSDL